LSGIGTQDVKCQCRLGIQIGCPTLEHFLQQRQLYRAVAEKERSAMIRPGGRSASKKAVKLDLE
jgi:hypothetical protein